MNPKLARLLIRCYSAEWRARYADEFAAFLEESPASAKVLFDVAKVGLLESLTQRLRRRAQAFRGVLSRPARVTSGTLVLGAIAAFVVAAQATPLLAMHRSGETFLTSPTDSRVKYEPGAARISTIVSQLLPRAIEETQYRAFINSSFAFYICTNEKTLKSLSEQQERSGKYDGELVYISPQSVNDSDRIVATLEDHLRRLKNEERRNR
jgi:hypothetical protein